MSEMWGGKPVTSLKVKELQSALGELGLRKSGVKSVLQERLLSALAESSSSTGTDQTSRGKQEDAKPENNKSKKKRSQVNDTEASAFEWNGTPIESLRVVDLRKVLKELGLPSSGVKSVLLDRLSDYLASSQTTQDNLEESEEVEEGEEEGEGLGDEQENSDMDQGEQEREEGDEESVESGPVARLDFGDSNHEEDTIEREADEGEEGEEDMEKESEATSVSSLSSEGEEQVRTAFKVMTGRKTGPRSVKASMLTKRRKSMEDEGLLSDGVASEEESEQVDQLQDASPANVEGEMLEEQLMSCVIADLRPALRFLKLPLSGSKKVVVGRLVDFYVENRERLTVPMTKVFLKLLNLRETGTKASLLERLRGALEAPLSDESEQDIEQGELEQVGISKKTSYQRIGPTPAKRSKREGAALENQVIPETPAAIKPQTRKHADVADSENEDESEYDIAPTDVEDEEGNEEQQSIVMPTPVSRSIAAKPSSTYVSSTLLSRSRRPVTVHEERVAQTQEQEQEREEHAEDQQEKLEVQDMDKSALVVEASETKSVGSQSISSSDEEDREAEEGRKKHREDVFEPSQETEYSLGSQSIEDSQASQDTQAEDLDKLVEDLGKDGLSVEDFQKYNAILKRMAGVNDDEEDEIERALTLSMKKKRRKKEMNNGATDENGTTAKKKKKKKKSKKTEMNTTKKRASELEPESPAPKKLRFGTRENSPDRQTYSPFAATPQQSYRASASRPFTDRPRWRESLLSSQQHNDQRPFEIPKPLDFSATRRNPFQKQTGFGSRYSSLAHRGVSVQRHVPRFGTPVSVPTKSSGLRNGFAVSAGATPFSAFGKNVTDGSFGSSEGFSYSQPDPSVSFSQPSPVDPSALADARVSRILRQAIDRETASFERQQQVDRAGTNRFASSQPSSHVAFKDREAPSFIPPTPGRIGNQTYSSSSSLTKTGFSTPNAKLDFSARENQNAYSSQTPSFSQTPRSSFQPEPKFVFSPATATTSSSNAARTPAGSTYEDLRPEIESRSKDFVF